MDLLLTDPIKDIESAIATLPTKCLLQIRRAAELPRSSAPEPVAAAPLPDVFFPIRACISGKSLIVPSLPAKAITAMMSDGSDSAIQSLDSAALVAIRSHADRAENKAADGITFSIESVSAAAIDELTKDVSAEDAMALRMDVMRAAGGSLKSRSKPISASLGYRQGSAFIRIENASPRDILPLLTPSGLKVLDKRLGLIVFEKA